MNAPTLAEKLGIESVQSSLLKKAEGLGLRSAESLENLAVARGCWHYRTPGSVSQHRVPESDFSNEELAVALLSPLHPYSPHTIRVGAAMVGADGNEPSRIVDLAIIENCESLLRYIATAAQRFEPANFYWKRLLQLLPEGEPIKDGLMPHPTRFISMTGITRNGTNPVSVWIRPRPDLVLTHG